MPRYYGIMVVEDDPPIAIGNFGSNEPKHLKIPNRVPDFPVCQVPFAEEARIAALQDLFAEETDKKNHPVVCRISDEGNVEAWFADIIE